MIDPLTAATSVAGLLSLTIQVSQILFNQIQIFKNAPKDAHDLLAEIQSLRDVLTSVERFLTEQAAKDHSFREASVLVNAINGCNIKITILKEKLERLEKKQGITQIFERGRWFFEREEHVEIMTALHRYLGMFQISLSTNGIDLLSKSADEVAREVAGLKSAIIAITPDPLEAQKKSQQLDDILYLLSPLLNVSENFADVSNTIKRWDAKWQSEETRKVLDWISPLNFWAYQQDTLSRKQERTCQWLFDDPIFQAWVDGKYRTLWCPGLPGAGKTVFVSAVIDFLHRRFETEDVSIGFMYCNYKEKRPAIDLIGALLQQAVARRSAVTPEIRTFYEQHRSKKTKLSLDECVSLLQVELSRYSRAFVVVDALDETDELDKTRSQLMSELQRLPSNTQLLVTSRHVPSIEAGLNKPQCLEVQASDKDVRIYLDERIEREERLKKHIRADPILRDLVIDSIAKKAQGMFILAQLHIDSISKKQNPKGVRSALQNLPQKLDQTYEEAMERILLQEEEDALLAKKVLSWILYAQRPMTVIEIQHATAVELDTKAFDEDEIVDKEILISVCAGLVTIDQESNVIRLIHYTAQEWFERNCERFLANAQTTITLTCLTYLSYSVFGTGSCRGIGRLNHLKYSYPLYEYIASNWGYHARGEPEQLVRAQILGFLAQKSIIAVYPITRYWRVRSCIHSAPPLCVTAFFGLKNIAFLLIKDKVNLDASDFRGRTALHIASACDQESIVQLLLEHGAEPAAKDCEGSTPLHHAAEEGHVAVAQLLLKYEARIEAKTYNDETPMFVAVSERQFSVVEMLLENRADVNARDTHNTVLHSASSCDSTQLMILLLKYGADIEAKDGDGDTPLQWAAEHGRTEAVKLLLSVGADPKATGSQGTPLDWAIRQGDEDIIRILGPFTLDSMSMTVAKSLQLK